MSIAEIPNVDVLREIIAAAAPEAGHAALRNALTARYPALSWRVADYMETWYRPGKQVFDAQGNVVAEDRKAWLKGLLEASAGNAGTVWELHRNKGYAVVDEEGHTVFAGAATGSRPEDAIEIKVDWIAGAQAEGVFDAWRPTDEQDLFTPCGREQITWTPPARPRYELRRMNAIARTLEQAEELEQAHRQHVAQTHRVWVSEVYLDGSGQSQEPQEKSVLEGDPDYLRRAIRERRFVDDWARSSAGATPILAHWAFDVSDYEHKGERHLDFTPRPLTWADAIEWEEGRSLYQLMDLLERFDAAIGHPMAWFFHSTYGNKLGHWAIRDVAKGLRRKKIGLPDCDSAVVRRWEQSEYGF